VHLAAAAELHQCRLEGANLAGADLRGSTIFHAHLERANLRGAHLEDASLPGTSLDEADLRGAHLKRADLRGTSLCAAQMQGANLRDAMLHEAKLDGADFEGALVDDVTGAPADHPAFVRPVVPRPRDADADGCHTDWASREQRWRTEPEIAADRQAFLAERRDVAADIAAGGAPFRGMRLTRADVEWLLATHTFVPGRYAYPCYRNTDLRGADLSGVGLHGLPLDEIVAGLHFWEWEKAIEEQRVGMAVNLEGANLRGASLKTPGSAAPGCAAPTCGKTI
jgi:uncharacterized protein YjbI with pentapeptide repeats